MMACRAMQAGRMALVTSRYDIAPNDRTYACGNGRFLWTGTGVRNACGSATCLGDASTAIGTSPGTTP